MAIQGASLAGGQLHDFVETLYTSPLGLDTNGAVTTTYVKFMRVVNTDPLIDTNVNVWYQSVDTNIAPILITPPDMILRGRRVENIIEKDETLCMNPGDSLLGMALDTNQVDFLITGAVET